MENMVDIGGTVFIIDLDSYDGTVTIEDDGISSGKTTEVETRTVYDNVGQPIETTVTSREYDKSKEIDAPRYDIVRMCVEILLSFNEELDDDLGIDRALAKTPISFKIAFNTLIEYGILKEIDSEE